MENCQDVSKPQMWVPKIYSRSRRNWFITKKYPALCDALQKPETRFFYYEAARFRRLIEKILTNPTNGLRIYFASYPDGNDPNVPADMEDTLTLIFIATEDKNGNTYRDSGPYYIMNPNEDDKIIPNASTWIARYIENQVPVLNSLGSFPQGDTTSLWFEKNRIFQLLKEMECQQVTGIRIYFSAYTSDDHVSPPDPHKIDEKLLNRTMLQLILTKKVNGSEREFEIEDVPGFGQRPDPPVELFNKAQLCPPNNCP